MAVVGRIAEADDDGHAALDRERAGVLLRDRLQEERGLKWFSVWAFERIGQEDVRAFVGQLRAAVAQGTADSQFADGIGADHQFKAVEVCGKCGGLSGDRARALLRFDAAQRVLDDTEQICAGAGGGVQCDYAGIGETEGLAQTLDEQIVDQAHLRAHDLDRRIVGTGVFAQVGIVDGKKVFVEVEPRVFGAGKCGGRHDRNDSQKKIKRSGDVGAGVGVGQNLQRTRQEIVLHGQRLLGATERERVSPFAAAQQQGEEDGLGVGVCELFVRCVREKKLPPVLRQLHEGRIRSLERVGYVIAQHAAQAARAARQNDGGRCGLCYRWE